MSLLLPAVFLSLTFLCFATAIVVSLWAAKSPNFRAVEDFPTYQVILFGSIVFMAIFAVIGKITLVQATLP